jgi:hypothetical protein
MTVAADIYSDNSPQMIKTNLASLITARHADLRERNFLISLSSEIARIGLQKSEPIAKCRRRIKNIIIDNESKDHHMKKEIKEKNEQENQGLVSSGDFPLQEEILKVLKDANDKIKSNENCSRENSEAVQRRKSKVFDEWSVSWP